MTHQLPPQAVAEAEALADGLTITGVRQRALLSYDDVRADEEMFEAVTIEESPLPRDSGVELHLHDAPPSDELGGDLTIPLKTSTPALERASDVSARIRAPLPVPNSRARASTQPPPPPLAAWKASSRSSVPAPPERVTVANPDAPAAVQAELDAAHRELERAAKQMRARDAYLRELENALEAQTRQLAAWGLDTLEGAARLTGLLRGQAFRIAELESNLNQANAALAKLQETAQPTTPARHDLQAIRGIGPRFEEQLRSVGIASYESVAALTADDIQRIATLLRIRPERIDRDGWIEQAKALCAK